MEIRTTKYEKALERLYNTAQSDKEYTRKQAYEDIKELIAEFKLVKLCYYSREYNAKYGGHYDG